MVSFSERYQLNQTGTPSPSASCIIFGCLSSSPIQLFLSEASLAPLRVALTHFSLSSYERAGRPPNFFPILDLARLGMKRRLCKSSWRAFASTYLLIFSSISDLDRRLGPFLFGIRGSGEVFHCSLCGTEATFFFWRAQYIPSFSAEPCAILQALCCSQQHPQVCHFSSILLLSDSLSVLVTLSSPLSFLLPRSLWQI